MTRLASATIAEPLPRVPAHASNLVPIPDFKKYAGSAECFFTSELRLLLACAACENIASSLEIRTFAATDLRWQDFLRLTKHHRLIPRVCDRLRQCEVAVPPKVLTRLRALYEANVRQTLRLTRDLLRVIKHFETQDIHVLPYKGPALAAMLQIDFTERQFSDIDLLVHPSDVQKSKTALAELGYRTSLALTSRQEQSYIRSGYEYSFDLPDARSVLELKWRILPDFYSVEFDVAGFFDRSISAEVGGHPVRTLCGEDMLLVLCVHAAKHVWSEMSLLWDISRLMESYPLKWDRIFEQANRLGIRRILDINLRLAQDLLGNVPASSDVDAVASTSTTVRIISDRILPVIRDAQQVDTESLPYFRLMISLRERWRDRISFFWRLLKTPSVGEWSVVDLPSALFSLYYFVRIYRIALRFLHPTKTQ